MEHEIIEAVLVAPTELPANAQIGRALKLFEGASEHINSRLMEARHRLAYRIRRAKANAVRLAQAAAEATIEGKLAAKLEDFNQQALALGEQHAKRYEDQIWLLALEIGSELARKEIESNPESLLCRIKEALDTVNVSGEITTVYVHPQQKDAIESSLTPAIKVVASDTISLGNAKIELGIGVIEVDWFQHLSVIKDRSSYASA